MTARFAAQGGEGGEGADDLRARAARPARTPEVVGKEEITLGDAGETLGETFFQEKEGFPQTPFEESRFAASGMPDAAGNTEKKHRPARRPLWATDGH